MNKLIQELRYYYETEDEVAIVNFSLDFHYRLLNGWRLISPSEHEGDKRFISAVWENVRSQD